MRKHVALLIVASVIVPMSSLVGCIHAPGDSGGAASGDVGSVGLALEIAPGVNIDSASYTVNGPGGFTKMGTIDLSNSTKLTATIGGLPAGAGYSITVSASTDGVACSGSAPFAVMAHATVSVVVNLRCTLPPQTGSVHVTGAINLNLCPVVSNLTATPAEVRVGHAVSLVAGAQDSDSAPGPLAYHWTAASGTFSNANAASTSFTCTAVGDVTVRATATDGDCSDFLEVVITCSPSAVQSVAATVETDPVPNAGDAADDPAIWVNPADPALSTIIGTDKTAGGGLGVYDLAGHQLQFFAKGMLNNVDLRAGFPLAGGTVALVTAGNRTDNSIAIFKIDPATRLLSDVAARTITTLATYGSCMYHSPVTGRFYYFVDSKAGDIEQWELFDNGAGLVDATKIRNLHKLGTQPEACVVDDELGFLYVGEEDVGIWKYNAEPTAAPGDPLTDGVLVDSTGPGGHLVADVEGLAIASTGPGTGYLITSNQGDSTYAIYERQGANHYLKTFNVVSGAACIDEVSGSDGIDVTTTPLGPAFPSGVFVTQDDTNTPSGNQNFKLVPLQEILNGPSVAPVCVPAGGSDGGSMMSEGGAGDGGVMMSEGGASDGPAGYPAEFCGEFCGKCAGCWNPTGGFSEGDCLYLLAKPNFSLEDCMAGCAAGRTPAFSPAILPAGWQTLACLDFDAAI